MSQVTRRTILAAGAGAASVFVLGRAGVRAQGATPATTPAAPAPELPALADYPILTATVSHAGLSLSSDTVPAGLVRFVVADTDALGDGRSAVVIGPGAGGSLTDVQAAAATPIPGDGFPPFLYDATVLGGPVDPTPGESHEVLLNIPEGDWLVLNDARLGSAPLRATISAESKTDEPAADAEIGLVDFAFTGLDSVTAGPQLWKITNTGAQPHSLALAGVPRGTTQDEIVATMMEQEEGTLTEGAFESFAVLGAGVLLLSAGQSLWLPLTLTAGDYAAVCFVKDPATGKSHATEGMAQLFTVT